MNSGLMRSGKLLAAAYVFEPGMSALRALVLAWLMPPEEFALTFLLSTIVAFAEMSTDIGLNQQVLRSRIENPAERGTLHSIAALRACGLAAILIFASPLFASVFQKPDSLWSFALVGLVVCFRGFSHLAVKQATRHFNYRADALTIIGTQSVWTVTAIVASFILKDHRGMVIGMLAYGVSHILFSHYLAGYKYQFRWDAAFARQSWIYGLPLLPNGIMLAISALGDRIAVGNGLGLPALAIYAPLITLAVLPRGAVLRFLGSIFLPRMIRDMEAGHALQAEQANWVTALSLTAVAFSLGFFCFAKPVITLAFGAAYSPSQTLVDLIAILILIRFLVIYPTPIALATGRTGFVTLSSAISAVSLAPAALALYYFRNLEGFLVTLIICEMTGLMAIIVNTNRVFNLERMRSPGAIVAAVLIVNAIVVTASFLPESLLVRIIAMCVGMITAALVFRRGISLLRPLLQR